MEVTGYMEISLKILEMIAASGFLTSSECTNFVFGRGGAVGELVEGGLILRERVYRAEREGK